MYNLCIYLVILIAQVITDGAQVDTNVAQVMTDVAQVIADVAQVDTDVAQVMTDVAQVIADVTKVDTKVIYLILYCNGVGMAKVGYFCNNYRHLRQPKNLQFLHIVVTGWIQYLSLIHI